MRRSERALVSMRSGTALAALSVVGCVSAWLGQGCGKSSEQPLCQHPCDLAQTFRVEITGAEPAAMITVSDPCSPFEGCSQTGACRSASFTLNSGGSTAGGADAADLVCRVTAVSATGERVERDVSASYSGDRCCAGYEFFWGTTVALTFPGADASTAP